MFRGVAAGVLVLASIACSGPGWQTRYADGIAYRYRPGAVDFAKMEQDVMALPSVRAESFDAQLRVVVPERERIYLFTRETHAAHPAVIVLHTGEAGSTPVEGLAGGDLRAFEAWLKHVAREWAGVAGDASQ